MAAFLCTSMHSSNLPLLKPASLFDTLQKYALQAPVAADALPRGTRAVRDRQPQPMPLAMLPAQARPCALVLCFAAPLRRRRAHTCPSLKAQECAGREGGIPQLSQQRMPLPGCPGFQKGSGLVSWTRAAWTQCRQNVLRTSLSCKCSIVGFTTMSKEVKPDQVMSYLNELFTAFDALVDTYQIYKVRECKAAWRSRRFVCAS